MSAPGAMPRSVGSLPAIRPATAVPCWMLGAYGIGCIVGEIVTGDDLISGPNPPPPKSGLL